MSYLSIHLVRSFEEDPEFEIGEKQTQPKGLPSELREVMKGIPDAHLIATKGDRDQQIAWAVAELFTRGEEINNQTIREIIRIHLAITPPNEPNTSRSLQKLTPKYIMREKGESGKAYSYSPTINLIELFDDLKDIE